MSEEEWEEILNIPDKGIYRVRYHEISLKSLRTKKTRTLHMIATLRRKIIQSRTDIIESQRKLDHLEKIDFDNLIREAEKQTNEAEQKARNFLKEWIGQENFHNLEQKGFFVFTASNGKRYRIKKNAQLQEDGGKWWYTLCTIKPHVPIPDVIASTFSAVQNQEPRLFGTTRKTQTDEEVEK